MSSKINRRVIHHVDLNESFQTYDSKHQEEIMKLPLKNTNLLQINSGGGIALPLGKQALFKTSFTQTNSPQVISPSNRSKLFGIDANQHALFRGSAPITKCINQQQNNLQSKDNNFKNNSENIQRTQEDKTHLLNKQNIKQEKYAVKFGGGFIKGTNDFSVKNDQSSELENQINFKMVAVQPDMANEIISKAIIRSKIANPSKYKLKKSGQNKSVDEILVQTAQNNERAFLQSRNIQQNFNPSKEPSLIQIKSQDQSSNTKYGIVIDKQQSLHQNSYMRISNIQSDKTVNKALTGPSSPLSQVNIGSPQSNFPLHSFGQAIISNPVTPINGTNRQKYFQERNNPISNGQENNKNATTFQITNESSPFSQKVRLDNNAAVQLHKLFTNVIKSGISKYDSCKQNMSDFLQQVILQGNKPYDRITSRQSTKRVNRRNISHNPKNLQGLSYKMTNYQPTKVSTQRNDQFFQIQRQNNENSQTNPNQPNQLNQKWQQQPQHNIISHLNQSQDNKQATNNVLEISAMHADQRKKGESKQSTRTNKTYAYDQIQRNPQMNPTFSFISTPGGGGFLAQTQIFGQPNLQSKFDTTSSVKVERKVILNREKSPMRQFDSFSGEGAIDKKRANTRQRLHRVNIGQFGSPEEETTESDYNSKSRVIKVMLPKLTGKKENSVTKQSIDAWNNESPLKNSNPSLIIA